MVNRVVLVGRLTRDPELRKTQTGKSVLSFSLAVKRRFSEDQSDFINCVAWDKTADFISNYLRKGSLISVEGSIQSRSYEDQTGKKVFVQEVYAEQVNGLESRNAREQKQTHEPRVSYHVEDEPILEIDSDDLPF